MAEAEIEIAIRREVEALHDFIAGWIRGEIANDKRTFQDGFAARLDQEFRNIQPNGGVLTRDDIVGGIRGAHGASPDFAISVHDVALRGAYDGGTVFLATYLERQTGAKNTTPPDNDRVSSVLMRRDGDGRFTWLHLHETARN